MEKGSKYCLTQIQCVLIMETKSYIFLWNNLLLMYLCKACQHCSFNCFLFNKRDSFYLKTALLAESFIDVAAVGVASDDDGIVFGVGGRQEASQQAQQHGQ